MFPRILCVIIDTGPSFVTKGKKQKKERARRLSARGRSSWFFFQNGSANNRRPAAPKRTDLLIMLSLQTQSTDIA
jgi:hypothetical protein